MPLAKSETWVAPPSRRLNGTLKRTVTQESNVCLGPAFCRLEGGATNG